MAKTVIKVENLSKLYRLGEVGTGTISHDLNRWLAKMRGKEDPFALVGQTNDRTQKARGEYVWALNDVNFEVKEGEVLGIIGKNGAGKSTLLKLLSQITAPTNGEIKIKGRIAALLEVGTGMHPEMTARENIYLNGAILGMRKHEIKAKFDEIVEFSGCAMYVDTPIKRFSSGMRVRLGFAVAAFLEPEILVVDEVLAVGDAEFQKKAIGKMKEVSGTEGRTVLFVSHNMQAVKNLCNRAVVMENGSLAFDGKIEEGVDYYLNSTAGSISESFANNLNNESVKINSIVIHSGEGQTKLYKDAEINIDVDAEILIKDDAVFHCTIHLFDEFNNCIFYLSTGDSDIDERTGKGNYKMSFKIPANILHEGDYRIGRFLIVRNRAQIILEAKDVSFFRVSQPVNTRYGWSGKIGIIRPIFQSKKVYTGKD